MNATIRNALTIQLPETPHAQALADLIPARARALGCIDFEDYCDLIDREATAHLTGGTLDRVDRIRKMRRPRAYFDRKTGTHCLSVCLNPNRTMLAKVWAADWIDMQEIGANGLWQGADTFSGIYVSTTMPLKRQAQIEKLMVSRLILDLGPDEQAGFTDGDTLNLRRDNLFVTAADKRRSRLRSTRAVAQDAAARRTEMVTEGRTSDTPS